MAWEPMILCHTFHVHIGSSAPGYLDILCYFTPHSLPTLATPPASSMSAKPSIVVVPGSFSPAYLYDNVIAALTANGYEAQTIEMPSVGRKGSSPAATMAEDAAHIQSATSKLANEGKDVILVTHSYGGVPGTESVKGIRKAERENEGMKGGVIRIVYLTSLIVPVGFSVKMMMGDTTPDFVRVEVGQLSALVVFCSEQWTGDVSFSLPATAPAPIKCSTKG